MGIKVVANNKKAFHDYFIDETFECGLALAGTEVKSLRQGQASLKESFCRIVRGEIFIDNMNIPVYEFGNRENHEPTRRRKLLLHKEQIHKIGRRVDERGFSLVPTRLYLKKGLFKLEIGLARGKKLHDKRETLKRKMHNREMERAIKEHHR